MLYCFTKYPPLTFSLPKTLQNFNEGFEDTLRKSFVGSALVLHFKIQANLFH